MKTTTLPLKHSMNRAPFRLALLLIPLALVFFALSPQARAVCQHGCDLISGNTFLGDDALLNNTTGSDNTANGLNALFNNTEGSFNTATGSGALFQNTTGAENTGYGWNALSQNTTGVANTAVGVAALVGMNGGSANAAFGESALGNTTTGNDNTAIGAATLINNSAGSNNIALGRSAGQNLTTGNNNIEIGNQGVIGEANTIRIGTQGTQTTTFIAGIAGAAINGRPVMINGNGRLGTAPCSARYKDEIEPMDAASEVILALKPVTFRYKKEIDADRTPQFGLIAEDVEKVNPALVARDEQGKPYTVRYDAVNAMLLNEFLKEHKAFVAEQRKVREQGATIARQQKQIEALTAGLQKVSAQLELNQRAPETVSNNH